VQCFPEVSETITYNSSRVSSAKAMAISRLHLPRSRVSRLLSYIRLICDIFEGTADIK
jgi:hypothetical protein